MKVRIDCMQLSKIAFNLHPMLNAAAEASTAHAAGQGELLQALERSGPSIVQALLRALMGPAGLPRVHKAACVLARLAVGGDMTAAAPLRMQRPAAAVLAWLAAAASGLVEQGLLGMQEGKELVHELGEVLGLLRQEQSGSAVEEGRGLLGSPGGRSLKRTLRAFAERHQR